MEIRKFKLPAGKIALIQFIIEGYEGIGTVTTLDPCIAIIQVDLMPDFISEGLELINSLKKDFELEETC